MLTKERLEKVKEELSSHVVPVDTWAVRNLRDALDTIDALEAEIAASRELGPCGHPKMFQKIGPRCPEKHEHFEENCGVTCTLCDREKAAVAAARELLQEVVDNSNCRPGEEIVSPKHIQVSGPQCKNCGAFTTYARMKSHGLCMRCEAVTAALGKDAK